MNNFTPRAQQVLALARKEADRFNHNYVGTEHLLLGLIKLGQGVAGEAEDRVAGFHRRVRPGAGGAAWWQRCLRRSSIAEHDGVWFPCIRSHVILRPQPKDPVLVKPSAR